MCYVIHNLVRAAWRSALLSESVLSFSLTFSHFVGSLWWRCYGVALHLKPELKVYGSPGVLFLRDDREVQTSVFQNN